MFRNQALSRRRLHTAVPPSVNHRSLGCPSSAGAPLPPHPRALRVPLRPAARVLGVTACGMSGAWLSRDDCLLLRFARVILRAPHAFGVPFVVRLIWGRADFLGRAIASPCGSARAPIPAAPWHLRLSIRLGHFNETSVVMINT